jgi:hypothetical protein
MATTLSPVPEGRVGRPLLKTKNPQRRELLKLLRATSPNSFSGSIPAPDGLVRRKVGRNGFMHDFVGTCDGSGRRDDTHSADHGVKREEVFYLRLVAYNGFSIITGGGEDKILIQILSSQNVVSSLPGPCLCALV